MKRWTVRIAFMMLGLILVAAGCGPEEVAPLPVQPPPVQPPPVEPPEVKPPEAKPQEIVNLEFYTTPAGTPPYEVGLAIASMLRELHPWLRATTLETTGGVDAVVTTASMSPERKKYVLLLTAGGNIDLAQAHLGLGGYKRKYPDFKIFCSYGMTGVTVATYNPEIRTPQDLVGKRVGTVTGPPAYLGEALLRDGWGIYDKIQISKHRPPDVKDVLLAGIIDATIIVAGSNFAEGEWILSAYVYEVAGARKTYWLNVTPEDVERIDQKNPWEPIPLTIPKGAHGKDLPPEDLSTVAFDTGWTCWPEFDEEILYELLQFLYANAEEYTRRLPGQEVGYGLQFHRSVTEEILHPGALRYYKEQGIKIGR